MPPLKPKERNEREQRNEKKKLKMLAIVGCILIPDLFLFYTHLYRLHHFRKKREGEREWKSLQPRPLITFNPSLHAREFFRSCSEDRKGETSYVLSELRKWWLIAE